MVFLNFERSRVETFIYRLSHWISRIHDLMLGVDFEKRNDEWNGHRYPYEPTVCLSYRNLKKYIHQLYMDGKILNVMDVGCGKGKMLFVFSNLPVASVTGLEYVKVLTDIARKNIHLLSEKGKIKVPVDIIHGDAEVYDCYDKYNVFYLYNPFDEVLMERFIDLLNGSISEYPRTVRIIYCNYFYERILLDNGFDIETEFYYRTRVYVKNQKKQG